MNIKATLGLGVAMTLMVGSAGLTAAPVTAAPIPSSASSASPTASAAGPPIHYMGTRAAVEASRRGGGGGSPNLTYHGGAIDGTPQVILDFWGSQWASDPLGERPYLQTFLTGLGGGETWSASTTQYCSGISTGATAASCGGNFVGYLNGAQLIAVVPPGSAAAPTHPTQTQLANEAARVAGITSGMTASTQIVVATSHGNSATGFGTQYCAWHSSTTYARGTLSYTNLPYIPDAGAGCGQNFVNAGTPGLLDGVSIVEGHELGETLTDPFPNAGWLDGNGQENGDKCAWISPSAIGGAADITVSGSQFAVQTLWSDTFNFNAGGCVISYTSTTQTQ